MADAIVSSLAQELSSVMSEEIQEEVRLVKGVDEEVSKLASNLRAIQAVLVDAEQRQAKEETVRVWLDQLKEATADIKHVLEEWKDAREKLENHRLRKKELCSFFLSPCFGCKQIILRRDIAHKIKEVNEKLDDIAKARKNFNFDSM